MWITEVSVVNSLMWMKPCCKAKDFPTDIVFIEFLSNVHYTMLIKTWDLVQWFPRALIFTEDFFLKWTSWCFLRCVLWLKAFLYSLHSYVITSVKAMMFKRCEHHTKASPCSLIIFLFRMNSWMFYGVDLCLKSFPHSLYP